MKPSDVLDFWFGAPGSPEYGTTRSLWFTKSLAVDALIRVRFGSTVEGALKGRHDDWSKSARGAVALIIVLDQFTRNIFRDTPQAFSGDAKGLALAERMVASGEDFTLSLLERWFAYMPFEHAESIEAQRESVRLFEQLSREGLDDPLKWARRHLDVIELFGRFPHRNGILGRESTPEEIEFLARPGSRF